MVTANNTDWEEGEPCPHCGCEYIAIKVPREDVYESSGGYFDYMKTTDYIGQEKDPMCKDCEEFL